MSELHPLPLETRTLLSAYPEHSFPDSRKDRHLKRILKRITFGSHLTESAWTNRRRIRTGALTAEHSSWAACSSDAITSSLGSCVLVLVCAPYGIPSIEAVLASGEGLTVLNNSPTPGVERGCKGSWYRGWDNQLVSRSSTFTDFSSEKKDAPSMAKNTSWRRRLVETLH